MTNLENKRNRGLQKNNTSGYKGVSLLDGKWRATITAQPGDEIFLGMFDDPKEAALAYNNALEIYHGEFGRPNKI